MDTQHTHKQNKEKAAGRTAPINCKKETEETNENKLKNNKINQTNSQIENPQSPQIFELLILDVFKHDFLPRLNLQQFTNKANEWSCSSGASECAADVLQLDSLVDYCFG